MKETTDMIQKKFQKKNKSKTLVQGKEGCEKMMRYKIGETI